MHRLEVVNESLPRRYRRGLLLAFLFALLAVALLVLATSGRMDRGLAAGGLALLALAMPCLLLPVDVALIALLASAALDGFRIEVGISLTPARLALALLAVRWLALQVRERKVTLHRTPLTLPAIVWLGTLVLALPVGPSRVHGLRVLLVHFCAVLCLLLVSQLARSPRTVRRLAGALVIVGLIGVAYGVVQWIGHRLGVNTYVIERTANASGLFSLPFHVAAPQDSRFAELGRAHFFFYDWNVYAGYLLAFWPLLLSLSLYVWTQQPRRRLLGWGLLAASVVTSIILLVTFSRSGWLGAMAALAAVSLLLRSWLASRRGIAHLAISVAAVVMVVVTGLIPAPAIASRGLSVARVAVRAVGSIVNAPSLSSTIARWEMDLTEYHAEAYTGDYTVSAAYHLALLGMCWDAFRDSPALGVGTGGFQFYFNDHAPEWMRIAGSYADASDKGSGMMAHSALLNSFAEGGILRGIAYLGVFLASFSASLRAIRSLPRDDCRRAALVGLLGCAIGLFVANIVYDYSTQPFVWVLLALLVVAVQAYSSEDGNVRQQPT